MGYWGSPARWADCLEAALQADVGNEVRLGGLKHERRSAAMKCYVGLDVSVKETSVCIVDEASKVLREVKLSSEPEAILVVLADKAFAINRIGQVGPIAVGRFQATQ